MFKLAAFLLLTFHAEAESARSLYSKEHRVYGLSASEAQRNPTVIELGLRLAVR